jgi:hypothetical protein
MGRRFGNMKENNFNLDEEREQVPVTMERTRLTVAVLKEGRGDDWRRGICCCCCCFCLRIEGKPGTRRRRISFFFDSGDEYCDREGDWQTRTVNE